MFSFAYMYNTNLRKRRRSEMSVNGIGGSNPGVESLLDLGAVKQASASPSSDSKPLEEESGGALGRVEQKSAEEYAASEAAIYAAGSNSSTEDFLFLRGLGEKEGQFDALDATIKEMKENMKEMGEFVENMSKLMEQASGDQLAMKLLEATVEKLEETQGTGNNIDIKA